jgi:hypothetical protein
MNAFMHPTGLRGRGRFLPGLLGRFLDRRMAGGRPGGPTLGPAWGAPGGFRRTRRRVECERAARAAGWSGTASGTRASIAPRTASEGSTEPSAYRAAVRHEPAGHRPRPSLPTLQGRGRQAREAPQLRGFPLCRGVSPAARLGDRHRNRVGKHAVLEERERRVTEGHVNDVCDPLWIGARWEVRNGGRVGRDGEHVLAVPGRW